MMKINLKEIWRKQKDYSGNQAISEEFILDNNIVCSIGYIRASNSKMFQIEIGNNVSIEKNYLKRFHGVEIRLLPGQNSKRNITIILSDHELLDVFILFLEDLIGDIEVLDNYIELPLIINKKVNYWGKLFSKIKIDLLPNEKQRGLYGELKFLELILQKSSNSLKCISSWTGPHGSNQDFNYEDIALELKTSKASKPTINIANEFQLDCSIWSKLFMAIVHVDDVNKGKETLYKLITKIKDMINDGSDSLQLFEYKLELIGIPPKEELHYDDLGFLIRSLKYYHITEDFPALTSKVINNLAIHNVQYQLDITAFKDYEIESDLVFKSMI
ncbi:PD-(D/E)XK motif protein [Arenibacter sp. 6A1]|uniref:PD-(D/E)XK motif protein n=1 Tax=Arenibacter sp. 6A1 TaxID=2720391 RepID=UPI0014483CB7|nr:PD-(D/E)XK motif protein [Arenibacter sp. 6A1]NKI26637.1 PD-(D/E)XK motif protein [Arenibacter sp. 6A1]